MTNEQRGHPQKTSEYLRGEGGSQIPMLQDIQRYKLGKSGSKFRNGGGGYQKRPKKI